MTLTVRLDDAITRALTNHCAARGTTKSHVVQQSLAAYLMHAEGAPPSAKRSPRPSAAFTAFEAAGLLGTGALGTTPADKAAVRRRITGGG